MMPYPISFLFIFLNTFIIYQNEIKVNTLK
uniref:Uncharacterized protein n=1 Tax=Siphoviridae sp. ctYh54 TaxID=2826379 RepID=A0A8S5MEA9_9CAUD|nr:MAG TPA: hypothetical protein [Siphoviridae sp. ctYh54]